LSPTSPLLPEVLTTAINDRTTRAKEERDALVAAIPALQQQTELLQQMQAADREALDRAATANAARLAETNDQVEAVRKQQDMVAQEAQKLEDQLDSRRNDVFRLELQHRLLEADLHEIDQNLHLVAEQIRLIEDELDKARRRSEEMDARGMPAAPAATEPGA
jgi:chromosome segregation ATPase